MQNRSPIRTHFLTPIRWLILMRIQKWIQTYEYEDRSIREM